MMGNIINKARIKKRSLVITLLDLKNAFGEVHHNFISSVLTYHDVPESMKSLISGLYTNSKTSIITDHYRSPAIPVCRGVLQADCLSPLLFNMCFNPFIQFINAENLNNLAFLPLTNLIACSIQDTGFCLLMMLQLLQVVKKTISFS